MPCIKLKIMWAFFSVYFFFQFEIVFIWIVFLDKQILLALHVIKAFAFAPAWHWQVQFSDETAGAAPSQTQRCASPFRS